ncbi:hypothetical protein ACNKXS_13780 [Christiangramia marina]|uniref:hypothetical protein n=1 Tax=Christiangramia marina TaxID=409436 RepID=UPI003AA88340
MVFASQISKAGFFSQIEFFQKKKPADFGESLAQIGVGTTYGTANNIYSLFKGGRTFSGEQLQGDHRTEAGLMGFLDIASMGTEYGIKSTFLHLMKPSFKGFNKFAKETKGLFSGVDHAKVRGKSYRTMIERHNADSYKLRKQLERISAFQFRTSLGTELLYEND